MKFGRITQRVNKCLIFLLASIVFGLLQITIFSQISHAVNENNQNVPSRYRNQIYNTWGQVPGGGGNRQCGTGAVKYNTGGFTWLSATNNNASDRIIISQGTTSAPAQLNSFAIFCDSVITNGNIDEPTFKQTRSRVTNVTAQIVVNPNGAAHSVGTNNGLVGAANALTVSSGQARLFNNRYMLGGYNAGDDTSLPSVLPVFKGFTITGLGSLTSSNVPYVLRLTVTNVPVNEYQDGTFTCVVDGYTPGVGYKYADDLNDSTNKCKKTDTQLDINILVAPQWFGECSITPTATRLQPGQRFGAKFSVTNRGTRSWDRRFVKFGSAGDTTMWGPIRVSIPGSGVLSYGNSQTFDTSPTYFTAPNTPGTYLFRWRLIQENTNPANPDFPGPVDNIAWCDEEITVSENRSYPYVRGTTNDIWTGAVFSPDSTGQCTAYAPSVLSTASSAKAQANTLNSLTVLDGAKPRFERAAVYVARMYKAILGPNRAFETSGGTYWINEYISGRSEADLVDAFLGTAEAQARMGGTSNTLYVQRLYQGLFERTPTSGNGEVEGWVNLLNSGWSRGRVARAIIYNVDNGPFGMGSNFNFGGSGSEYGVFATGENQVNSNDIGGLFGGNGLRSQGQSDIFDLTFANINTPANTNYGSFSDSALCLENYFLKYDAKPKQTVTGTTTSINTDITNLLNTTTSDLIIRRAGTGSLTLSSEITLQPGANIVLLVDGDINITSPRITYSNSYGTTDAPNAPRLVIISRGTMTIARTVTQLDGIYIAQPKIQGCTANGSTCTNIVNTGIIQTCSAAEYSNNAYQIAGSRCGESQLKVNGSLIAQTLRLYRRYGSIGATFDTDRGNLASLQCAALKNFWATNPASHAALYSTKTPGTVNQCAGEWVDAHPERYFNSGANDPITDAQSYKELPPIY